MAGFFDFLKPIAKTAAPFIPGIGQYLPAAISLLEGGKADRASQRAMNASGGYYRQQLEQNKEFLRPLLEQLMQQIQNPVDTATPEYRSLIESAGRQSNAEVNGIMADYASRGLGGDSSGLAASIANSRYGVAASANEAARRAFLAQQQRRDQLIQYGIGAVGGMGASGANGLGGLGGLYASRAGGYQDSLGKFGELSSGIFGNDGPIGGNKLNTNSNPAPNPFATSSNATGGSTSDYGWGAVESAPAPKRSRSRPGFGIFH